MAVSKEENSLRCSVCRGTGRKDGKVGKVCGGSGEIPAKTRRRNDSALANPYTIVNIPCPVSGIR